MFEWYKNLRIPNFPTSELCRNYFGLSIAFGLTTALDTLVSQAHGAGQHQLCNLDGFWVFLGGFQQKKMGNRWNLGLELSNYFEVCNLKVGT